MEAKRLGIFPNMTKEKVCADLQIFVDLCREQGLVPLLPKEICTEYNCEGYDLQDVEALRKLDFAVSLGGDGTLLKMALYLAPLEIPAFGVNFGKLGFLAEIDQPSMRKAIMRLVRGDYSLENRSLLRAQVMLNDECIKEVHALNDLVLAKVGNSRSLDLLKLFL